MSSKIGPVYLGTIEAVSRRLLLRMAGQDGHGLKLTSFNDMTAKKWLKNYYG